MSDIDNIRRSVSLADTARAFGVDLEPDGREWVGCCPLHQERTPSFTIFTGKDGVERFQCFGCDAKGDVIDFTAQVKGVSTGEAIRILGGETRAGANIPAASAPTRDIYAGIEIHRPIGELAVGRKIVLYNPKRDQNGNMTPSAVYPYRRSDGSVFGYVLRRNLPDGGKETPMVCWVRLPDGSECWARMPFPKPRMLYGLDRIGESGQVVVVEGEKCADAIWEWRRKPVVSWPGGTSGAKHCDWSPLAGRNVLIWPDADDAGLSVSNEIATILSGLGCTIKMMDLRGEYNARDDF